MKVSIKEIGIKIRRKTIRIFRLDDIVIFFFPNEYRDILPMYLSNNRYGNAMAIEKIINKKCGVLYFQSMCS
jgi:hypothetical protein